MNYYEEINILSILAIMQMRYITLQLDRNVFARVDVCQLLTCSLYAIYALCCQIPH